MAHNELSTVSTTMYYVCCIITGAPHSLKTISLLVSKLTDLVNEKKVWIYDKEEHLLGMSKQLTAIISDWDTETQQMIDKLHQARDEHVIHFLTYDLNMV